LRWKILDGLGDRGRDSRTKEEPYGNVPPRYNGRSALRRC
jgi:hypothetical protein